MNDFTLGLDTHAAQIAEPEFLGTNGSMKYSRVYIDAIGYETAAGGGDLGRAGGTARAGLRALHLSPGSSKRSRGSSSGGGGTRATRSPGGGRGGAPRAWKSPTVPAEELDVLIYAGVCRELFEPATACRVAAEIGVGPDAAVYDISNACLGVLNGMVDVANRIELGQIRAGLVVACETAREINDIMIERMLQTRTMEIFKRSLATLTGGSGAVAVLLTDGSFSGSSGGGGCSAGHCRRRPSSTRSAAGGSRRSCRSPRATFSSSPPRTRPPCSSTASSSEHGPGGPFSASSAGSTNRSTRSSATRSARGTEKTILKTLGIAGKRNSPPIPTWATSAPSRSP